MPGGRDRTTAPAGTGPPATMGGPPGSTAIFESGRHLLLEDTCALRAPGTNPGPGRD